MACRDDCVGKKAKPRFKGIENFLRRVAFNLGNSPSQTEVKIISCIPIDVTDLQQKIIHLEKQLEEVKSSRRTSAPRASTASTPGNDMSSSKGNIPTLVNTAQVHGRFTAHTDRAVDNCSSELPSRSLSQPKSAVSYESQPLYQQKLPPMRVPTRINEASRRQLFKKNRKLRRHTPLIYYAQTVTSPFNCNRKESTKKEKQKAAVDLSYFTDIIHKQFTPGMYVDELMGSSEVSAPVCRDGAAPRPVHECDVCSCCRGYFHDIDRDRQPYSFLDTSTASNPNIDSGNVYYNSSLYDLIPVKEKPETNKKEMEKSTKREPKFQCEAKCWAGHYRSKPLCSPMTVNYAYTLPPAQRYAGHRLVKSTKTRERNRGIVYKNDVSRNTSVECGDIYTKQYVTGKYNPPHPHHHIKPHIMKRSVQCLTRSVNDTECQTDTGRDLQNSSNTTTAENKTESTLNQIKNILQSVLSHVKTNTLAKNQSEDKGKKEDDTLVHGSVAPECSRLLNSYTYSPFSIDSYIASCSRGLPTLCPIGPISSSQAKGFPVIPNPHFKCMQNFPVFIQPGHPRQHCTSCNRATGPSGHPKQTSTNTLTRSEEKRNIETENLIKEIYKSIALNMTTPQKRISRTNYNYLKSSEISRNQLGDPVVSNMMTYKDGPSDRSLKGQMIQTLMSTATASIATSSTRTSQPGRTPDDQRSLRYHSSALRGAQLGPKSVNDSTTTTTTMTHRKSRIIEENEPFSEDSEDETASDNTIVSASNKKATTFKENDKVGIFSKLFGSVFKKRRRKSNRKEASTSAVESAESDSDDYETIYSQKVEPPARPKHVTYASSPHHSRKSLVWRKRFERPRHTKYMDPENRRYWDEQLGFHTTPPPTARSPPSILRTPPPARAPPPRRAPPRPVPHGITLRTRGKRYQPVDSWYASLDPPHPPFGLKKEVEYAPDVPYRESKPRPPRLSVGLRGSNKKLSWLKRHNQGLHCGEQWKKTQLEG